MTSVLQILGQYSFAIRRVFLVLGVIIVSFPRPISKLVFGGDPSWMAAINSASYNGMVFGRDLLFTYGPLGFVLNPVDYGPESWIKIAVAGHLIMYGIWWLSMGLVVSRMEDTRDAMLFLAGSFVASYLEPGGNILPLSVLGYLVVGRGQGRVPWSMVAGLVAGLALLVKFNVGVSCVALVVAWSVIQVFRGPWKEAIPLACLALMTTFGSAWAGYRLSGGDSSDFVSFLKDSLVLAQDYSSQMSWRGPFWQEVVAGLLVFVVAAYATLGFLFRWKGWDLAAVILPSVFLGYKSGIVRHDPSHYMQGILCEVSLPTILVLSTAGRISTAGARQFSAALLFAGLSAVVASDWNPTMAVGLGVVACLALTTLVTPDRQVETEVPRRPAPGGRLVDLACLLGIVSVPVLILAGIALPRYPESLRLPRGPRQLLAHLQLKSWLASPLAMEGSVDHDISDEMIKTIGRDSIDGYPMEISLLLHHEMNWTPRFVIQSYQSYSPPLDGRSSLSYAGRGAPKFVMYEHVNIDYCHTFLVDPATFEELYRWYDYQGQSGARLLLIRRSEPRWKEARPLGTGSVGFDERWVVPDAEAGPIRLKAKLALNAPGRLKRTLHKIIPPMIRIEYLSGVTNDHRLVWKNTEEGFLVSDLPRDLASVRRMFEGGRGDRVRAVTFLGPSRAFEQKIDLVWSQLEIGHDKPREK